MRRGHLAQRGAGGMREVALQVVPDPRDQRDIAGLAVAQRQPREDAEDAQVALGAERGAGAEIEAKVRNVRTVTVDDREIEVGSENSRIPVRQWQWSGPEGKMLAVINYDREQSHEVHVTAEGITNAEALLGPEVTPDGDALVIDLGPGEMSAVTW